MYMMQYLQVISFTNSFITEEGTFPSKMESAGLAHSLEKFVLELYLNDNIQFCLARFFALFGDGLLFFVLFGSGNEL